MYNDKRVAFLLYKQDGIFLWEWKEHKSIDIKIKHSYIFTNEIMIYSLHDTY